jgi:hypothetical protein
MRVKDYEKRKKKLHDEAQHMGHRFSGFHCPYCIYMGRISDGLCSSPKCYCLYNYHAYPHIHSLRPSTFLGHLLDRVATSLYFRFGRYPHWWCFMGRLYDHPEVRVRLGRRPCGTFIHCVVVANGGLHWRPPGEAKKLHAYVLTCRSQKRLSHQPTSLQNLLWGSVQKTVGIFFKISSAMHVHFLQNPFPYTLGM